MTGKILPKYFFVLMQKPYKNLTMNLEWTLRMLSFISKKLMPITKFAEHCTLENPRKHTICRRSSNVAQLLNHRWLYVTVIHLRYCCTANRTHNENNVFALLYCTHFLWHTDCQLLYCP